MKVDTMRKIDFWVGVPLCFIATFFVKLGQLFLKKKDSFKKVLFIELSEMGSTILVDPAMKKLKQATQAELYFAIFKKNKVSLDILKTIPEDNIFVLRDDNILSLLLDVFRFIIWCQRHRFDAAIDLELFSRATALLTGATFAPARVGFYRFHQEGLYRGEMLTHRVAYNPHIHISKNFIALINALLSTDEELPYSKTFIDNSEIVLSQAQSSPEKKAAIYQKIQKIAPSFDPATHSIVLINPNASDLLPQRRWMPECFIELMTMILTNYPSHYILITGSPSEHPQAEMLRISLNNPRCINFAGHIKFLELIDLYHCAKLMVTNDSGPGHFSAVTPLKTFVIFGPETPALYGSLGNSTPIYAGLACSPCVSASNHRKTPCTNNVCLKVLTPQRVYKTIEGSL
jgi:ADP-heptose:LPS heptosyltransferase